MCVRLSPDGNIQSQAVIENMTFQPSLSQRDYSIVRSYTNTKCQQWRKITEEKKNEKKHQEYTAAEECEEKIVCSQQTT